ncbi:MAG: HAD family hydrolase [bacterium]|nr:HAD family hydrolase [bacterium]
MRVVQLAVPTAGAVDCLKAMRSRDWTLALVTNGSSGQQHAKIDALGFRDLVDAVCVSGDLGVEKPSPEIFELAAEQASASLAGAWMVGDSPANDVNGGLSLGLKTAWVSRGRGWPNDLPPPTVSIGSRATLVDAIDRN